MQTTGECRFGEGCSFYHDDGERRSLIDPLPNLPEGVTLPPMPEKIRQSKPRFNNHPYQTKQHYNDYGNNMSPNYFSPMNTQPAPMIQITSIAEMAAFGGFNPNKYLCPAPIAFSQAQPFGYATQ